MYTVRWDFHAKEAQATARSANLHVGSKLIIDGKGYHTEKVPSCIRMHDSPYENAQHGGCPIWRPRVARGDIGKVQGEMVSCRTGIVAR